jgi:Protein of unknown function DUF262
VATLDRPRLEYRTPVDLVDEVRRGLVRIPPFQRGFRWESSDVIALFDSLLQGYPVGNLLFWRRSAPAEHVRVGPLEIDAPRADVASWVVDGQQRITSLVGALTMAGEATDARFRIHLDLATGRFHSLGPRQATPRQWLPVNQLVDTSALLRWLRENAEWLTDGNIAQAESVAKAIREYQIPTYVVTSHDEKALRIIFDRLNNTGKPLSKAEVFHALHSGMSPSQPTDLRAIGSVPAEMGFGAFDDQVALRCVLAYRGGDIYREDFAAEFSSDEDRVETFREVGTIVREVVDFLRGDAGIPHIRLLPYAHVVPVLVRFVRLHGAPSGRIASLLRRWVWRDAATGIFARGTSVVAVRAAVSAMDAADGYAAADALLRRLPNTMAFVPQIERVHLNHAAAKINLLGLLSMGPRDLTTGDPLDAIGLLDERTPVREIVADPGSPLSRTFANRAAVRGKLSQPVRSALADASEEVALSHLVDRRARELLAADDQAGFLDRRAQAVVLAIRQHVDTMAEWGARGGRSVADMIRSAA